MTTVSSAAAPGLDVSTARARRGLVVFLLAVAALSAPLQVALIRTEARAPTA